MAMFDYKSYTPKESSDLAALAFQLARSNAIVGYMGGDVFLPILDSTFLTDGIIGSNRLNIDIPSGWRALTPSELGLPQSALDATGHYIIDSPITGTAPGGAQVRLLGQFDAQGKLLNVAASFTPTGANVIADAMDDILAMNSGAMAPAMAPLLDALKNLSIANGLDPKKAIFTGYSQGGAMTNVMAKYRETLVDGYFSQSNYYGFAASTIYDNPDVIVNFGAENDVVYRIMGDAPTNEGGFAQMGFGLTNLDRSFASTFDSIINFDDAYASILWPTPIFSVLNPAGWSAHFSVVFGDSIPRILSNPFYEYMDKDSTIVIASMSALPRLTTWVEDKWVSTSNHYGSPAFIIGSAYDDSLKGNKGGDYIYGGAGNDTIKVGLGADRVDGGAGIDTVRLDLTLNHYNIYHLKDGTVFAQAKDGSSMVQMNHVEQLVFEGTLFNPTKTYEIGSTQLIDKSCFIECFNINANYAQFTEGSNSSDSLTGSALFGKEGDDILNGTLFGSLLHGGEGNDVLKGSLGADQLFGAEGNDKLIGSIGKDLMFGGIGNDQFVFNQALIGNTQIMDFNHGSGESDSLVFSKSIFANHTALAAASKIVGNDVLISQGLFSVTIHDAALADVWAHTTLI